MNGTTMLHQQPFAHWISWMCAQFNRNEHMPKLDESRMCFKGYTPIGPRDCGRGPRFQRREE